MARDVEITGELTAQTGERILVHNPMGIKSGTFWKLHVFPGSSGIYDIDKRIHIVGRPAEDRNNDFYRPVRNILRISSQQGLLDFMRNKKAAIYFRHDDFAFALREGGDMVAVAASFLPPDLLSSCAMLISELGVQDLPDPYTNVCTSIAQQLKRAMSHVPRSINPSRGLRGRVWSLPKVKEFIQDKQLGYFDDQAVSLSVADGNESSVQEFIEELPNELRIYPATIVRLNGSDTISYHFLMSLCEEAFPLSSLQERPFSLQCSLTIATFETYRRFMAAQTFDMIFVCQTRWNTELPDPNIPGYSFIRRDRNSHGGGVVVFYRSELNVHRLQLAVNRNIEIVGFTLTYNQNTFSFFLIYLRPKVIEERSYEEDFNYALDTLRSHHHISAHNVVLGSFSMPHFDWESRIIPTSNRRVPGYRIRCEAAMKDLQLRMNLKQFVNTPTFRGKLLDVILTDQTRAIANVRVVPSSIETEHEDVVFDFATYHE